MRLLLKCACKDIFMGFLIKIIIICLVVYWSVKFVSGFFLPVYRVAKRMQQKNATHSAKTNAGNRVEPLQYKGGEYIEYEELD